MNFAHHAKRDSISPGDVLFCATKNADIVWIVWIHKRIVSATPSLHPISYNLVCLFKQKKVQAKWI